MQRITITLVAALAACGDTTDYTQTQLNLDRPVDIAFACYGGLRLTGGGAATPAQEIIRSAQPAAACNIRSQFYDPGAMPPDPVPVPPGQEDLSDTGGEIIPTVSWYGLILQQGPGTVALALFSTRSPQRAGTSDVTVLDSDPFTPGKNGVSVGEDPIAIATDATGCYAVTANAGSCDLSVIDIGSVLDNTLTDVEVDPGARVMRREVTNASGVPLRAKPAAMVAQPQTEVIGNTCTADATGIVYVAYPSCQLVAGVDTATGRLVAGIQYDAAGTPQVLDAAQLGAVTCPDECELGQSAVAGARPVALDLEVDPRTGSRQLVIGAENLPSFAIVQLDADAKPASLRQVAFEDPTGTLGITSLALSPVIGMGGQSGTIIDNGAAGGDFQFVYAVATDDTVRVAEVLTLDQECDTQVDPRFLPPVRNVRELSCLPVGDPATPRRRAGARGPGIELVGDAVPLSVEFARSPEQIPDNRPSGPNRLIGYFAFIAATSGQTFVVNVDDDDFDDLFVPSRPLLSPIPKVIAHQLRDAVPNRGELAVSVPNDEEPDGGRDCSESGDLDASGVALGGPRAAATPTRTVPSGTYEPQKITQLPGIRQVLCEGKGLGANTTRAVSELQWAADEETRFEAFPDLRGLRGDETWTLTWEGLLSNDSVTSAAVDGPAIRESLATIDGAGMHIIDQTSPFCEAGVEMYDIVQFRGCDPGNGDVDCPLGYTCYTHPESQVPGLGSCMLEDEAERLATACQDFLTSVRRYTVAAAHTGELVLVPRRHELRTTPLDGCVSDDQCATLAMYLEDTVDVRNPIEIPDVIDGMPRAPAYQWACVQDPLRAPIGDGTGRRCEMTCQATDDCAAGLVCQEGFCMEGVTPPQACVNAPQRYTLNAHEAFTVLGSRSGYVHDITADETGRCVKDPTAHPLQIGRIPLEPRDPYDSTKILTCDPAADPLTGQLPGGGFEANPCATTVNQVEPRPRYIAGTCTLDTPSSELVNRAAPAVKFRNRGFTTTIVDPYYPGDENCIADRLGYEGQPLAKVPVVFSGYALSFRQVAGFSPVILPTTPTFPVKVVRGPSDSIWIVDEGDFLSTSTLQPSTRGKVFRVEPTSIGVFNELN